MHPRFIILDERTGDTCVIGEVTIAAFKALEISRHTEQFIVEALRAARDLTISLVAELDGRVVGHIAGHEGVPPEVFFALTFDGRIPQGTVAFHPAFAATVPAGEKT